MSSDLEKKNVRLLRKERWIKLLALASSLGAIAFTGTAKGEDAETANLQKSIATNIPTLVSPNLAPSFEIPEEDNSLRYIGVADDDFKDPQYDIAFRNMKSAKKDGFDSALIEVRWWQHQTRLSEYDRLGVCNAARAAGVLGMKLVVRIRGDAGNPPLKTQPTQYEEFTAFNKDIVDSWLGRDDYFEDKNIFCDPDASEIIIEPWNEPNLPAFMHYQERKPDGFRQSAWLYTGFMDHLYRALNEYEKDIGTKITIWGGTLGSSQDPVNFIRQMGKAMGAWKIKSPIMDAFSYHPYEDNSNVEPGTEGSKGFGSLSNIRKAVQQNLGRLPIIYSEVGWESTVPPDRSWMYSGEEHVTVKTVSERTLGEFYIKAYQLAQEQGVGGLFIFKYRNECDLRRWQSGLYHCDGQSKETRDILRDYLTSYAANRSSTQTSSFTSG